MLITGAASGLGLAAAADSLAWAQRSTRSRVTRRRAADAVAQIDRAVPGADARPQACDLASLAEVRSFGERFAAAETRLDVLVNNAGTMPADRTRSPDGHELTFATHVLAPLALTTVLTGPLRGARRRG